MGLWMRSSLDALNSIHIAPDAVGYFSKKGGGDYFAIRPTSYMANIGLDLGLVGMCAAFYLLKPILRLLKNVRHAIFPVTLCFLYGISGSGAAGNPVAWACMALIYRKLKSDSCPMTAR
jgi:hypothetical protein